MEVFLLSLFNRCNLHLLYNAPACYRTLSPIYTGLDLLSVTRRGGGGGWGGWGGPALGAPPFNYKTSHGTATKITQNDHFQHLDIT